MKRKINQLFDLFIISTEIYKKKKNKVLNKSMIIIQLVYHMDILPTSLETKKAAAEILYHSNENICFNSDYFLEQNLNLKN